MTLTVLLVAWACLEVQGQGLFPVISQTIRDRGVAGGLSLSGRQIIRARDFPFL